MSEFCDSKKCDFDHCNSEFDSVRGAQAGGHTGGMG